MKATPIILTEAERAELEGLARSTKTEHRLRQRARIVLAAADGMASRAIGRTVGCTTGRASKWRVRYAERRLAGLDETGTPLLTAALGDVDVQYIWRFLRAQKIDLAGRKSWCESDDPQFVAKTADVVGLYMAPPENAI
jgi:Homeodomain-like domain